MAELKTKENDASVADYLNAIPNDQVRQDCLKISEMMRSITQHEPKMWGDSIVGFGSLHYVSPSGRAVDWMLIGFSPRKQNITLYLMTNSSHYEELLPKLGKHSLGKGCLYIKRLADIDLPTLEAIVQLSVRRLLETNTPE